MVGYTRRRRRDFTSTGLANILSDKGYIHEFLPQSLDRPKSNKQERLQSLAIVLPTNLNKEWDVSLIYDFRKERKMQSQMVV